MRRFTLLSYHYNMYVNRPKILNPFNFTEETLRDIKLLHFIDTEKPWELRYNKDDMCHKLWQNYFVKIENG